MFDWAGNMLEVDDIVVMASLVRRGLCQGTVKGFKGDFVEIEYMSRAEGLTTILIRPEDTMKTGDREW